MQKRNVLYIGNKLSNKGMTVSTIDTLSLLLEQEGFTVFTASSRNNKVLRLFDMLFSTLRHAPKVSCVLIDTYSTQNFFYAVMVAKLCRILAVPYVPILHGGDLPKRLSMSPGYSKRLFEGAKINVAPSKYLMEAFQKNGYQNIIHIPNSVEIENYPFLLRKEIQPRLLWVRSFAEIYNPLLAIEVLKKLTDKGVKASLTMVGPEKDGSLEKCKVAAKQDGLPVVFTGKLSRKEWIDLSVSHDIFINTTNFDNMPVSLIEAASLGLPIITTNVGGIPFLVDEKTSVLVPPNNAEAFVEAINNLLEDSEKTESLSKKGYEAAKLFDWEKVKKSWLALMN